MTLHSLSVTTTSEPASGPPTRGSRCSAASTHGLRRGAGSFGVSQRSAQYPVEGFTQPQRLHKLLAHIGLGSRRDMEQLIFEGRVSVNGRPAEISQKIGPQDVVRVNGKPVQFDFKVNNTRLLIYYKPEGEIVSRDDPEDRPTVFARLPKLNGARWVSVGRLDHNTSGLLLFTTSGDLANRMMHPHFEVEREYSIRVHGRLTNEQMVQLTNGVMLDDGLARFSVLVDAHPEADTLKEESLQLHEPRNYWYRATISEGRNREIRKMLEAVGGQVTRLIRIRYGDIQLPQNLRRGQWWELDERKVVRFLEKLEKGTPASETGQRRLVRTVISRRRRWLGGGRRRCTIDLPPR